MPYASEAVTELLRSAVKALDDAAVPEDLRETAFEKAFDALAGTAPAAPPRGGDGGDGSGGDGGGARRKSGAADSSAPIGKIAVAVGVDEEAASHVFDVHGDDLVLTITRDQLDENRAAAVREIAILVAAGRQAAGLDEDRTHTNHVRHEAEQLGVISKNSFKAEMGKLGNVASTKPAGTGRELKITRHGNTEAGKIVQRITGGAA
jgi:hypothetical protein